MNNKELITSEKKLVKRCLYGDKKAWEEFIDQYKNLIYSSIIRTFRLMGWKEDKEVIEDLFQDIFTSLFADNFKKLRLFGWKKRCTLASWLSIISRNATYDYVRKNISRRDIISSLIQEAGPNEILFGDKDISMDLFIEKLESADRTAIFEKVLAGLSKEDRYLLELLYHRELSPQEAAIILGESRDVVYKRAARAIEKIKKIIKVRKEIQ